MLQLQSSKDNTISASRDHFTPSLLYIMLYWSKFDILNNLLLIIQPSMPYLQHHVNILDAFIQHVSLKMIP